MHSNATTPLRTIALISSGALDVLERFGIDYCCRGDDPLDRACAAVGVSADQILPLLRRAAALDPGSAATSWLYASVSDLVTHLAEAHDAPLGAAFARIREQFARALPGAPELRRAAELFESFASELEERMRRERIELFPHVVALERARHGEGPWPDPAFGPLRDELLKLRAEGRNSHEKMRQIRAALALPAHARATKALREWLDVLAVALHRRLHLEINVLFPLALPLEPEPPRATPL